MAKPRIVDFHSKRRTLLRRMEGLTRRLAAGEGSSRSQQWDRAELGALEGLMSLAEWFEGGEADRMADALAQLLEALENGDPALVASAVRDASAVLEAFAGEEPKKSESRQNTLPAE